MFEETLKREESSNEKIETEEMKMEMKKTQIVKVLFGGDVMFDRYIRSVARHKGFNFIVQEIDPLLEEVDFTIANLEGPITEFPSKSIDSEFESRENYIFTFPMETARFLFEKKVSIVNIGNNHIMNFGSAGLEQTRATLKSANVKYFGDPLNSEYRWYVKETKGVKIGFVSYNQFIEDGTKKALEDIEIIKSKADIMIVYAHWGEEYETISKNSQKELAHRFIDNGVDLVIGSHPHVVQEVEEYKGKKIYYSLGNFIFDQYFEEKTKNGLLVKVTIENNQITSTEEIAISMETNGQTKQGE